MLSIEDVQKRFRASLRSLKPYAAVETVEAVAERAGIPAEGIIKLNGSENLYGCSPRLPEALKRFQDYHLYPDSEQRTMRKTLAQYVGMGPEHIVVGSGSDELILLALQLFIAPGDKVIDCDPTFGMYAITVKVCGGDLTLVPRDELFEVDIEGVRKAIAQGSKLVFLASPNNPTGNLTPPEDVVKILEMGAIVVVDETYYEFCGVTVAPLVERYPNLIVLRSFSKWAGLAGLRLGYAIAHPQVINQLMLIKLPYNVSQATQVALAVSLEDRELLMSRVKKIVEERERMAGLLGRLEGVRPWPSQANFVLCQVAAGRAKELCEGLARQGILVRYFGNKRFQDSFFRVSVGLPEHTDILIKAIGPML